MIVGRYFWQNIKWIPNIGNYIYTDQRSNALKFDDSIASDSHAFSKENIFVISMYTNSTWKRYIPVSQPHWTQQSLYCFGIPKHWEVQFCLVRRNPDARAFKDCIFQWGGGVSDPRNGPIMYIHPQLASPRSVLLV